MHPIRARAGAGGGPYARARNVFLADYYGEPIAGFYQYGTVTWTTFFRWLSLLSITAEPWIIVQGDRFSAVEFHPCDAVVMPGRYTLLAQDKSPLRVKMTPARARRRQPTPSRAQNGGDEFARVSSRDSKCMVLGQMWGTLRSAHIFSRAHLSEWDTAGHASLITDTAATTVVGGISKIGSVQNLLLLSEDLHDPWGDYQFGVDPDDDYRITAFVPGLDRIVGRALLLDHISDPTTRPLDQLLRDHFLQCLLKHVKGSGEQQWDYARTFGTGSFDLSDEAVWGTEEGKERLELELEERLFDHRLRDQGEGSRPVTPAGLVRV